jgi:hypothetical protein
VIFDLKNVTTRRTLGPGFLTPLHIARFVDSQVATWTEKAPNLGHKRTGYVASKALF